MNVRPGDTYEAVIDWGATGIAIGMTVRDNEDNVTVARVTGFTESPAGSGVYVRAGNVAPTVGGQYTLYYDDDGGTAAIGHVATEDLVVSATVTFDPLAGDTYASVEELLAILNVRTASAAQTAKAERVLVAAAGEIDRELNLSDVQELDGPGLALAAQVNLARAAELWKEEEIQFGILGIGSEIGTTYIARDTWDKHAIKLSTLKGQWGLA